MEGWLENGQQSDWHEGGKRWTESSKTGASSNARSENDIDDSVSPGASISDHRRSFARLQAQTKREIKKRKIRVPIMQGKGELYREEWRIVGRALEAEGRSAFVDLIKAERSR